MGWLREKARKEEGGKRIHTRCDNRRGEKDMQLDREDKVIGKETAKREAIEKNRHCAAEEIGRGSGRRKQEEKEQGLKGLRGEKEGKCRKGKREKEGREYRFRGETLVKREKTLKGREVQEYGTEERDAERRK